MSSYDPFSYGQVKMGGDADAPKTAASAETMPDDILFAKADPLPTDSSWGLLEEDMNSLLPGGGAPMTTTQFGEDVLGAAAAEPAPVKPRAATTPRAEVAVGGRPAAALAGRPAGAGLAAKPAAPTPPVRAAAVTPAPVRAPIGFGRGRHVAGWIAPLVVLTAGGSLAAWLYLMQQNQVLGGIVIGLSIVAATFARVFFRG